MDARILIMFVCSASLAAAQGDAGRTSRECVAELGSDDPLVRDRATEDLIAYGPASLTVLRGAVLSTDPEVARRAAFATGVIEFREKIPFSDRFLLSYPDVYGDLARGKDPVVLLQEMEKGTTMDKELFLASSSGDIECLAVHIVAEHYAALSSEAKTILLRTFGNSSIHCSPTTAEPFLKDENAECRRLAIGCVDASDDVFLPLIDDPDPEVRATAIRRAGKVPDRELVPQLDHDHPSVRRAALNGLGCSKDRVPLIVKALKDPDAGVRCAAIDILRRSGDPESAEAIASLLQDPESSVVATSLRALMELGSIAHLETIVNLLESDRNEIKQIACSAVGQLIEMKEFAVYERKAEIVNRLLALLHHKNPSIRARALRILRQLPSEVDRAVVAPLMFDENSEVRQRAVALVKAIDPGWFLERAGWLLNDGDEYIVGIVLEAVRERKSVAIVDDILKLLAETRSIDLVRTIIYTVIAIPEAEAADDLVLLLRAKTPRMLSEAVQRLSESDDPNIRRQIGVLLKHPDDDVRAVAVEILKSRGMREYASALFLMIESDNVLLRRTAVEAIAGFGDRESARDLLPLLRDPDGRVRASTARALMKVDGESFAGIVAPLLKDRDSFVRAEIAGLFGLGSRHHGEVAMLLRDPDSRVRMAALYAFQNESAREHVEEIARFLEDESKEFRQVAVIALRIVKTASLLPRITPLLRDESEDVRYATLDLLDCWDARECIDLLYLRMQDPNGNIRSKVYELIERWESRGMATIACGRR